MRNTYFLLFFVLFSCCSTAWFNESWDKRIEINITETSGKTRINQPIEIQIGNCTGDARLIKDQQEQTFQATETCKIAFLLNLTGGTTDTFYLYYQNPEAPEPSYESLNYLVFNDTGETWTQRSINTPEGMKTGNALNISKGSQTLLRTDTGLDNFRQYGSQGCMEYFSLAGFYRSMGDGSSHYPSFSGQEIAECGPIYCKIEGTSSVDEGKMVENHTLTIFSTGLIFTEKRMQISEDLSTDDFAYEDGKVGFYIDERGPCDSSSYLNVYDNGSLFQWNPSSCSGYNDIDTSHYLGYGDWVSRSLSGRGTTFAFFVNHTRGYDYNGVYGELGANIMHSTNNVFLTILRQGLDVWHPHILPAGTYSLSGWHKTYCDVTLNDSASIPEQDANQLFAPLTITLSEPQERPVNHPPVLETIQDISVYAGENVTITPVATDPDEDTISYSISDPVGDDGFWETSSGDVGVYYVLIAASDGNLSDNQTVTVTVLQTPQNNTTNHPPILQAIEDATIYTGETFTITPVATDPDEDTITYTISDPIGDDGFWETSEDDAGSYLINVTASDETYTVSTLFTLDVLPLQNETPVTNNTTVTNHAPQISQVENIEVLAGDTITIHPSATDPDNDTVEYSITETSGKIIDWNITADPYTAVWKTGEEDVGNYTLKISASDGNLTDTIEVGIRIKPAEEINETGCEKNISVETLSILLENIIRLEELKINFISLSKQSENLRDFYSQQNDTEKAENWQSVIENLNMLKQETDALKEKFKEATKDASQLEYCKQKLSKLIEKVEETLRQIIEAT